MNVFHSSIRQFVIRTVVAIFLIACFNILLVGVYIYRFQQSVSGETAILPLIKQISGNITMVDNRYEIPASMTNELEKQNIWAMLIDDHSGKLLWIHKLPQDIPTHYTLSDIASFTRYYLKDYPVVTWKHPKGLIVLGYPKNSLSKLNYIFPYGEVQAMPFHILFLIVCDLFILFLLYFYIGRKSIKSVHNILTGVKSLASGYQIHLKEYGDFSEVANQLNRTSDLLKRRQTAQENWIAGISHDIRTPLTVILGYAESIETNSSLPKEVQNKASLIKYQSTRLRDLVNDLNLITRMGDDSQVLRLEVFYPSVFCRALIASFLNSGVPDIFSVELNIDNNSEPVCLIGDRRLLQRAIYNLIHNCIKHNPAGCNIYVRVEAGKQDILFIVSDNGRGMTPEEIHLLKTRTQYLGSDNLFQFKQHGFGLYIVQQIVKMHSGSTGFQINTFGGLEVVISIPI